MALDCAKINDNYKQKVKRITRLNEHSENSSMHDSDTNYIYIIMESNDLTDYQEIFDNQYYLSEDEAQKICDKLNEDDSYFHYDVQVLKLVTIHNRSTNYD